MCDLRLNTQLSSRRADVPRSYEISSSVNLCRRSAALWFCGHSILGDRSARSWSVDKHGSEEEEAKTLEQNDSGNEGFDVRSSEQLASSDNACGTHFVDLRSGTDCPSSDRSRLSGSNA